MHISEIRKEVERHKHDHLPNKYSIQVLQRISVKTAANWLKLVEDDEAFLEDHLENIKHEVDRAAICERALDGDIVSLAMITALGPVAQILTAALNALEDSIEMVGNLCPSPQVSTVRHT